MMKRIDRDFVDILNVLTLLREHPMSYEEILKSGYFKTKGQLDFALRRLKEGCCVEKIQAAGIYCILGHGLSLLSFFPTWKCLTPEIFDIVVPIGEGRNEENSKGRCRYRHYPYHNKEG
jgi:hypothetical protein